jgi:hypothetical protein
MTCITSIHNLADSQITEDLRKLIYLNQTVPSSIKDWICRTRRKINATSLRPVDHVGAVNALAGDGSDIGAVELDASEFMGPVVPVVTQPIVSVVPVVTTLNGNPVSTVNINQPFMLHLYVRDLRDTPQGFFAAYADLQYNASMVPPNGELTIGPQFVNGHSGDTSAVGLLDEIGGFAGLEDSDSTAALVFSIEMNADSLGSVDFTGDLADLSPLHDIVLRGNSGLTTGEVQFETTTIDILNRPHQNFNEPADVSGDGKVTPLDALRVINRINAEIASGGDGSLPATNDPPTNYLDVNGDGYVSAIDVSLTMDSINRPDDCELDGCVPLPLPMPCDLIPELCSLVPLPFPGINIDVTVETHDVPNDKVVYLLQGATSLTAQIVNQIDGSTAVTATIQDATGEEASFVIPGNGVLVWAASDGAGLEFPDPELPDPNNPFPNPLCDLVPGACDEDRTPPTAGDLIPRLTVTIVQPAGEPALTATFDREVEIVETEEGRRVCEDGICFEFENLPGDFESPMIVVELDHVSMLIL